MNNLKNAKRIRRIIEIYIRDRSRHVSTLATGRWADRFLEQFYQEVQKHNYPTVWIENPLTEEDFWEQLAEKSGLELRLSGNLKTDKARIISKLKVDRRKQELFMPKADQVLYEIDIKQESLLGASLRKHFMQTTEDIFNIHFSARRNSNEYKRTFETINYPYYHGNFLQIMLDRKCY